jgi:hypothetical protein
MEQTRIGVEFISVGNDFMDCIIGLNTVLGAFEKLTDIEKKRIVASISLAVGIAPNTDFNLTQPAASQVKS